MLQSENVKLPASPCEVAVKLHRDPLPQTLLSELSQIL
jgi:hypothetical protein